MMVFFGPYLALRALRYSLWIYFEGVRGVGVENTLLLTNYAHFFFSRLYE